jgi:hypothetical protein
MTQTWDCTEARLSLGVYVLGAIDPAERALVDAHLSHVPGLPGRAGRPGGPARAAGPGEPGRGQPDPARRHGPDRATDERPPPELLGTVLDLAAARRRRNRWRFAAAAAAVVAIAGGLFGGLSSATSTTRTVYAAQYPTGTGGWETAQTTSKITGVSATIKYAPELLGQRVRGTGERHPGRDDLRTLGDHPTGPAPRWPPGRCPDDEGRVWYPGSAPDSSWAISSFQITAGNRVLLTATT